MSEVQILGRVRPGKPTTFTLDKPYARLDRVVLDGAVYECIADTAAGEGPDQAPEKWIVADAGIKPAEVRELRESVQQAQKDIADANTVIAAKQDAASASTDKAALQAELAKKAVKTDVDAALSKKADSTAMTAELAKKAVKTDVDAALALKAVKADVETALSKKADSTAMTAELAKKAVKTDVETALAKKLDKSGGVMTSKIQFQNSRITALQAPSSTIFNRLIEAIDKDGEFLAYIEQQQLADGRVKFMLDIPVKNGDAYTHGTLTLVRQTDGTFFVDLPALPDNAPASAATTITYVRDNFIQANKFVITLYVGGANASDTADIHNGRGLSSGKPFATVQAAINFVEQYFVAQIVIIKVQGDVNWGGGAYPWISNPNIAQIIVEGDVKTRVVTLATTLKVFNGALLLRKFKLNFTGTNQSMLHVNASYRGSAALLCLGQDLELAASVTDVVQCMNGNAVVMLESSITGTVTGRRYNCCNGGRIFSGGKGPNAIPGTVAGVCDASSAYV